MSETGGDWLSVLNPGDEVVVSSGYVHRDYVLRKVDRVTATMVIVDGLKYRRIGGGSVGQSGYSVCRLEEPTAARRESIWRQWACRRLREMQWDNLSTVDLSRAIEIAAITP